MIGALDGIRVLDLSRYAPGPYCTMIMGDLGADVIKVEGVGVMKGLQAGDKPKGYAGPVVHEYAAPDSPYDPLNRNKRSIGINLKDDQGREIFLCMVKDADVVLEGFRPGVTKRLKIDYPTLKKTNSGIIYCSITGFGQDGPYSNLPGHDINYISHAGAISLMKTPTLPGNLIGDIAGGGMQAVIGILAALIAREKTGEGQFVDISMTDGVVSMLGLYLGGYFRNKRMPDEADRVSTGAAPYYNIYKTKDDKLLSLGCSEPPFFINLCKALGCEEYIPLQADVEKADEIKGFFTKTFLTRTRDEWFELLSKSDIAVAKVNELCELADDPQLKHRQMVIDLDHPEKGNIKQVGISIKLSETPGSVRKFSPKQGEDTEEILLSLGYSEDQIKLLSEKGVVGPV